MLFSNPFKLLGRIKRVQRGQKMTSMLFIYPPISFREKSVLSAYSLPLGILYLGAILKMKGHEVHVIDAEAEQLSLKTDS